MLKVLSKTIKVRLLLEYENHFLMLRQTPENGGKYTLIGGSMETKEFPIEALIRESYEEAGVKLKQKNLKLVHTLFKQKESDLRIVLYFHATEWQGLIERREPDKFERLVWLPKNDLPIETSPTVRLAIESYLSGLPYSEMKK